MSPRLEWERRAISFFLKKIKPRTPNIPKLNNCRSSWVNPERAARPTKIDAIEKKIKTILPAAISAAIKKIETANQMKKYLFINGDHDEF